MLNVLIIEDHPLITEAYKNSLHLVSTNNPNLKFKIDNANDCDSALEKIGRASKENGIDIFFLDLRLPPSTDKKILSGNDLAPIIKKSFPKSKIIVSTMLNDIYIIRDVVKNINPDAFLIKSEITPTQLAEAIMAVNSGTVYYGKAVLNELRNNISNNFFIDNVDRRLLYELSKGTKMKDMSKILPLSLAGVEKRKRRLNKIFGIEKSDNKRLIEIATKKGFI